VVDDHGLVAIPDRQVDRFAGRDVQAVEVRLGNVADVEPRQRDAGQFG
jgi:hypothetical protein